MCAFFFFFFFLSVSLSFIRPKPSRLFLHPSLLPQHNSKRMCVVIPSGLLCPTAPLPFLMLPPLLRQRLRKPPLLVVTSLPCSTDSCWDVWSSHLCSVFSSLLSLSLSFPLTNLRHPFPMSELKLFLSQKRQKKRKSLCVIFPREEVTRTFFLYSDPCVFTTGAQQIYLLADKRSSHLLKQGRIAPDITPAHNQIKRYR